MTHFLGLVFLPEKYKCTRTFLNSLVREGENGLEDMREGDEHRRPDRPIIKKVLKNMENLKIRRKQLDSIPLYSGHRYEIKPGCHACVHTGLKFVYDSSLYIYVKPRVFTKHLTSLHSNGNNLFSNGHLSILLSNTSDAPIIIRKGDSIGDAYLMKPVGMNLKSMCPQVKPLITRSLKSARKEGEEGQSEVPIDTVRKVGERVCFMIEPSEEETEEEIFFSDEESSVSVFEEESLENTENSATNSSQSSVESTHDDYEEMEEAIDLTKKAKKRKVADEKQAVLKKIKTNADSDSSIEIRETATFAVHEGSNSSFGSEEK